MNLVLCLQDERLGHAIGEPWVVNVAPEHADGEIRHALGTVPLGAELHILRLDEVPDMPPAQRA